MNYSDGLEVRVRDRIKLSDGTEGLVVCSFDRSEFSDDFPGSEWAYLESGILVLTDTMGLVHYPENEQGMALVERGNY